MRVLVRGKKAQVSEAGLLVSSLMWPLEGKHMIRHVSQRGFFNSP